MDVEAARHPRLFSASATAAATAAAATATPDAAVATAAAAAAATAEIGDVLVNAVLAPGATQGARPAGPTRPARPRV